MRHVEEVLTVRRWRRYGADRLFVTQGTGARVGSVDLQSGEVVVEDPELEGSLRKAAQEFLRNDVTELVLPVPAPSAALSQEDEAALRGWLGAPDEGPDELALRRERGSSVRARLDRLTDEEWHVLHGVPLGRQGNRVAHLLIGPAGIYTVSERFHTGEHVVVEGRLMSVDGRPVTYLRDARLEAERVQGMLLAAACAGASVRAVIVVHGELELRGPVRSEDALVVQRHDVPALFRLLPPRLGSDRAHAIAQVAQRRTTWGL
jgi:hypothetical protein